MEKQLTIRNFVEDDEGDVKSVQEMDDLSGNNVEEWIHSDMTYGLFEDDKLIGYLTLGYADDCGDGIENHFAHNSESRILSNVYIKKEHRGRGHGLEFIDQVLKEVDESIYLTFMYDGLIGYYEKLGFVRTADNSMYLQDRGEQ